MDDLTLAGLLILVIGTAVREIFGWMKQKNLMNSEQRLKNLEDCINKSISEHSIIKKEIIEPMKTKVDTLYDWHDKSDQDGVKIWYVRKSLEETLNDTAKAMTILAKNSEVQTKILEEINNEQRTFRSEQVAFIKLIETLLTKNTNN